MTRSALHWCGLATRSLEDRTPAIKYQLGDHLGSSNVVINDTGAWIDREEYTPYGETSFGSFAKKRYRFTGKERDEESGLYYHARYYAPWLGRWMSPEPSGASRWSQPLYGIAEQPYHSHRSQVDWPLSPQH